MLTKKKNNNNKDVCTATVGYNSKNNNNNNKNQNNNLNNDNNDYYCLNCSTITIIDNDNKNSKNEIQGMTIGSKYFCIEPMTFEIISKISWKVLSFVFVIVVFFLKYEKMVLLRKSFHGALWIGKRLHQCHCQPEIDCG